MANGQFFNRMKSTAESETKDMSSESTGKQNERSFEDLISGVDDEEEEAGQSDSTDLNSDLGSIFDEPDQRTESDERPAAEEKKYVRRKSQQVTSIPDELNRKDSHDVTRNVTSAKPSMKRMESETDVAFDILSYVCSSTVTSLRETYESKIYTSEYMKKLFDSYIQGETDSLNPLFKELISECIDSDVKDPYLKEQTKKVLSYIKEH